jgi:hypothetical protein
MCVIGSKTGLPYAWSACFQNEFPLSSPKVAYGKLVLSAVEHRKQVCAPGTPPMLVCADSAFGGFKTVETAGSNGFFAINAMRADSHADLFRVMSRGMEKGQHRTVVLERRDIDDPSFKFVLVTLFRDEGDFFTESNSFKVVNIDLSQASNALLQNFAASPAIPAVQNAPSDEVEVVEECDAEPVFTFVTSTSGSSSPSP